ncbi:unnamed protein product [Fraxinus pennsylvanica]|uniref:BZIP domain-containing protein n=1 Tax=Fraxinus pennsylvanica TaxID=56036 RepID=A0AAD1ZWY3_9LAMI|nr:unnamed protein product [Fraxinus pennsylvanica]
MIEYGAIEDEQVDWDHVNFHIFDETAADELYPNSSPDLGSLPIEQFQLNDNSNQEELFDAGEFLSDVLLDSPAVSGWDQAGEVIDVPKAKNLEEKGQENQADVPPAEHNVVDVVDDDDPIAKKKKRQIRNRDAAVKSRERKKMYVRDLEMKSKYYEAECKRLGMLLQCCLAENQTLRLSLHNKAFDASVTRQESAVLLLESLLLGSLLWFLGIICLLILQGQLKSTLEAVLVGIVDSEKQGKVAPRKRGIEVFRVPGFQSYMIGKRCKASRSRIKLRFTALLVFV